MQILSVNFFIEKIFDNVLTAIFEHAILYTVRGHGVFVKLSLLHLPMAPNVEIDTGASRETVLTMVCHRLMEGGVSGPITVLAVKLVGEVYSTVRELALTHHLTMAARCVSGYLEENGGYVIRRSSVLSPRIEMYSVARQIQAL